jgi:hypothetical protein
MTTDKVGLYGKKDRIAATPEAYVAALEVIDEVIRASAANDGQLVTY